MKLCIDCRHILISRNDWETPKCALATAQNPVTGHQETRHCETERRFNVPEWCGPEARHFEARDAMEAA